MKNETLLEKLKDVGKHYNTHHDLFLLCREAAAEIERLGAEAKDRKEIIERSDAKLKNMTYSFDDAVERNEDLLKMYKAKGGQCDKLIEENIRLERELKKYTDSYNAAVSKNIRLGEQVEELEKSFPGYETVHINESEVNWNDDLSTRDHIAIAAMEGILSAHDWHPDYIVPAGGGHVGGQRAADATAEAAYKYADAMLKAREK
jgi:predicted nuclease with TOPRIM domain